MQRHWVSGVPVSLLKVTEQLSHLKSAHKCQVRGTRHPLAPAALGAPPQGSTEVTSEWKWTYCPERTSRSERSVYCGSRQASGLGALTPADERPVFRTAPPSSCSPVTHRGTRCLQQSGCGPEGAAQVTNAADVSCRRSESSSESPRPRLPLPATIPDTLNPDTPSLGDRNQRGAHRPRNRPVTQRGHRD